MVQTRLTALRFVLPMMGAGILLLFFGCSSRSQSHRDDHRGHRSHVLVHRFKNAEHWAKRFENPARDRWQKPAAVIARMSLRPDMQIADIGAATGYFTVRLARQVKKGRVWGIDVEPDLVRYLRARAKREGLGNLHAVLGRPADPGLPPGLDRVFLCNTYHHIPHRVAYFRNVSKRLKPTGQLFIVDFKLGRTPVGPPQRHRIPPEKMQKELTRAGFTRVLLDTRTLPYQYIAIYRPTPRNKK